MNFLDHAPREDAKHRFEVKNVPGELFGRGADFWRAAARRHRYRFDGSGYKLAKRLGNNISSSRFRIGSASLPGNSSLKQLAGVRADASVNTLQRWQKAGGGQGRGFSLRIMVFRDSVFQVSRLLFAAPALDGGRMYGRTQFLSGMPGNGDYADIKRAEWSA